MFGSIVAVVLPYRAPDLVRGLPGARWKVPLVSIMGVISTIAMLASLYFSLTIPAIGPTSAQADTLLVTVLVLGFVMYGLSYTINKGRGIDLRQVYSAIPPE